MLYILCRNFHLPFVCAFQVLTEENLDQIDELYKLISPTRDGETDYLESLSAASEHIVNLLDAKEKTVVGTTYKVLLIYRFVFSYLLV